MYAHFRTVFEIPDEMKVPAIERAAKVLQALAESPEPRAFGEVVEATGLPKSTVHDLCESLVAVRFVDKLPDGRMRLSWHLTNLVRHQLAKSDVVTRFIEECAATSPLPGETLVLSVLDGDQVLYLACRNGNKPLSVVYRLGMRLPALSTASGKAILASLPASRLETFRATLGDRVDAQRWRRYQEEFERIRIEGHSVDDEETAPGMFCIGAPVHSADSAAAVAAIAVSMVKSAASEAARAEAARVLTALAKSLSVSLGAPDPAAPR
jgi:DNA-binding IclR family transcriptional regulator